MSLFQNIIGDYEKRITASEADYRDKKRRAQIGEQLEKYLMGKSIKETNDSILENILDSIRYMKEAIQKVKKMESIENDFKRKYGSLPSAKFECLRCRSSHPDDQKKLDQSQLIDYPGGLDKIGQPIHHSYKIFVWECLKCHSKYMYEEKS